MTTPIIESQRILLRPLSVEDAETVFRNWTSDEEIAKYMRWDLHEKVEETKEWLKMEEENILREDNYTWGFVLKETNELIGSGGIFFNETHGYFELGYNIMKKYWGNGIVTEASKEILKFGEKELNIKKFFCAHAIENIGSKRVIEKLGFKYLKNGEYESFSGKKKYITRDYILEVWLK